MPDERRYFFILGMPRARTAWLSVALTFGESVCAHEGVAGCASFEEYAGKLRSAPSRIVGDSDAALAYWIPQLLSGFPNARFAVVTRPAAEALASLMAAEPERAEEINLWWDGYVKAFQYAVSQLEAAGRISFQVDHTALNDPQFVAGLAETLTGCVPPAGHIERLMDLRITTRRRHVTIVPPRPLPQIPIPREFLESRGVDADGLTIRKYAPEDYPMVNEWWRSHRSAPLEPMTLPPLGVVIEDEEWGPVGALWCYESFGVGVATLEWPVTRPGLSMAEAARVMSFAVAACVWLAGRLCEPAGNYHCFRVATSPPIARFLARLGFQREQDPRISMTLKL
jgi:hypothetical protein